MKDDGLYLEQMLDSLQKIESFTSGMDQRMFEVDAKTQSAVILQLMLIGELAKRISPDTKTKIDAPWKEIAGFRDKAIHHYFEIDLEVVWNTVVEDVPNLKRSLQPVK